MGWHIHGSRRNCKKQVHVERIALLKKLFHIYLCFELRVRHNRVYVAASRLSVFAEERVILYRDCYFLR